VVRAEKRGRKALALTQQKLLELALFGKRLAYLAGALCC
jgi:hypothetical protein